MTFYSQLEQSWNRSKSFMCVGLDTDLQLIPASIRKKKRPIFEFNREIIDATADVVCAYKLQYAYYGSQYAEADLEDTISYIHETYPGVPVILDAKRCDFDVSAEHYAKEAFDRYKADALTVIPFQGTDAIKPFLERKDKGVILLCKTSNPSSVEIQDLLVDGEPLYLLIAKKACQEWNYNRNVCLVVGGTFSHEMKRIRGVAKDLPFLIPGIGAQGGSLSECIKAGQNFKGTGIILSASRSVIYASDEDTFAELARAKVLELNRTLFSVNCS